MEKAEILSVWETNKPKILSYISKKVRREADVKDISQEIFIKFWINYNEINDITKILNWLYGVARHSIADHFRKKEKETLPCCSDFYGNSTYDNPETDGDESRKLLPLIHSLPVKYKNILLLSDIHGLLHKEIAQQFDLTISCVKKRVARARILLAERMRECCSFSYDKYGNIIHCEEKKAYYYCLKEQEEKD